MVVSSPSSLMFVRGFIVYRTREGALWTLGDGADENMNFPAKWISFDTPFFPLFHFDFRAIAILISLRAGPHKRTPIPGRHPTVLKFNRNVLSQS